MSHFNRRTNAMSEDIQDMFLPEPIQATATSAALAPWTVLIVDDDKDVHNATLFVARKFQINHRSLHFLHAYSSKEAEELLRRTQKVAVILLDVVMESETDGLDVIPAIRGMDHLGATQIILRTGQAGYHPEVDVIAKHDINGYLVKSEITESKLYSMFSSSIRAYETLTRQEHARLAVEGLLKENARYLGTTRFRAFAENFLRQVASSLNRPAHGVVCAKIQASDHEHMVYAATGPFEPLIGKRLGQMADSEVKARLEACLQTQESLVTPDEIVIFLHGPRACGAAIYLPGSGSLPTLDAHLMGIYGNNFAVCAENMALVADLSRLDKVDPLLSIPNQTELIAVIDKRLENFPRSSTMVAAITLNRFSEFSSARGARYADRLLYAVSGRLHAQLNPNCTIGRIDDSSFGIVSDLDWMHPLALERLFRDPFDIVGDQVSVERSLGLAYATDGAGGGAELLRNARFAATYAARVNQSDVAVYDAHSDSTAHTREAVVKELREAISQKQLFAVFQPRVNLSTGNVAGFEALLRWQKPDGSQVPPEQFIPFVERSGQVGNLDNFVLISALEALADLRRLGHTGLRATISISTAQLRQGDFLDSLEAALQEAGAAPQELELAITDSIAAIEEAEFIVHLQHIRSRGLSIALNDFGSGYSAVSHLEQIPADRIAIDRTFVWALESSQPTKRTAEMVIHLARQLDMKIVATGVDTPAQAEILNNFHCDEAQGSLFAKPLTLEEMIEWMSGRATQAE